MGKYITLLLTRVKFINVMVKRVMKVYDMPIENETVTVVRTCQNMCPN